MPVKTAEPVNIPTGESRWAIGPAKWRSKNIIKLVYMKIYVPLIPEVFVRTEFCHCWGPSSTDAVMSMQMAQRMNIGRSAWQYIAFDEIPASTRSVTGKLLEEEQRPVDQRWE